MIVWLSLICQANMKCVNKRKLYLTDIFENVPYNIAFLLPVFLRSA